MSSREPFARVVVIQERHPHPNANNLAIYPIPGTLWMCVATSDLQVGDLAIYIEPDCTVPLDRLEFSWLRGSSKDTKRRIRAERIRGILSYGLLIPAVIYGRGKGWGVSTPVAGQDVSAALGVERWEPVAARRGADNYRGPWPTGYPEANLLTYEKHHDLLTKGELVIVTEKLNGVQGRFLWRSNDAEMLIGTSKRWIDPNNSPWHDAYINSLEPRADAGTNGINSLGAGILDWCVAHPDVCLYGEIVGPGVVGGFDYNQERIEFYAFASWDMRTGLWDMPRDLRQYGIKSIPLVGAGAWDPERILPLAEGHSDLGLHVDRLQPMEGLVIHPLPRRSEPQRGPVWLKYTSRRYLEATDDIARMRQSN